MDGKCKNLPSMLPEKVTDLKEIIKKDPLIPQKESEPPAGTLRWFAWKKEQMEQEKQKKKNR